MIVIKKSKANCNSKDSKNDSNYNNNKFRFNTNDNWDNNNNNNNKGNFDSYENKDSNDNNNKKNLIVMITGIIITMIVKIILIVI